jgi:hypothetical protein
MIPADPTQQEVINYFESLYLMDQTHHTGGKKQNRKTKRETKTKIKNLKKKSKRYKNDSTRRSRKNAL